MTRILLLSALLFPIAAHASPITYTSYAFSGENVHLTDAPSLINAYVGAGEITLNTSAGPLDAWCVDVLDELAGSGTFNVLAPAAALTTAQTTAIGTLIYNGEMTTGAQSYAAVQDAIWTTEYGAALTITPDDAGVAALTATYLSDVGHSWTLPSNQAVHLLSPVGGGSQTLAFVTDPVAVPEPASWIPLAVGVVALLLGGVGFSIKERG